MVKISRVLVLGDSLSDEGEMYGSHLGNFFSSKWGKHVPGAPTFGPQGSFTNDLPWTGYLRKWWEEDDGSAMSSRGLGPIYRAQSSSAVHSQKFARRGMQVTNTSRRLMNYSKGGATAAFGRETRGIKGNLAVSSCKGQIRKYLRDHPEVVNGHVPPGSTLVISWFGANDLETFGGGNLTMEKIKRMVSLYWVSLRELLENDKSIGCLALVTVPDIAISSRYTVFKNEKKRQYIKDCCNIWNSELEKMARTISYNYTNINTSVIISDEVMAYIRANNTSLTWGNTSMHPKKSISWGGGRSLPKFRHANYDGNAANFDDVHPTQIIHQSIAEYMKGYIENLSQDFQQGMLSSEYFR